MSEATLKDIEQAAGSLASAEDLFREAVQVQEDEIAAVHKRHRARLRECVRRVEARSRRLHELVKDNPQLFIRPRTQTFHGVRVGIMKDKGCLAFDNPAKVIARIRKHLPDQADELINVTEAPNKKALAKLPASDLKRLGCEIEDAGDKVLVKSLDSATEKILRALIADALKDLDQPIDAAA